VFGHLGIALDAIRGNKLRSGLTALGIFIGVFTVIAMIGVIEGVNKNVEGIVNEELGTDTFWVVKVFGPNYKDEERRRLFRERKPIDPRDVEAVRTCDLVREAAPYIGLYKPVMRGSEKTRQVEIIGTTLTYLDVIHLDVVEGRPWTDFEAERGRQVAVIGRTVAQKLFPEGDYLGRDVRIDQQPFRVIGILKERGKKLGNDLDAKMLIPEQTMLKQFGTAMEQLIVVRAASPRLIEESKDQVIQVLRARRSVPAEAENDFDLVTPDRFTQLFRNATRSTAIGLTSIAFIALLVGGIGIMNIMLVAVTERTKEIGIRKAVGARRRVILRQFLVEAVVLTSCGGFLGLALAALVVWIIGKTTPFPASVPAYAPLLGLGICSVFGIAFGLFPAIKAAGLDPVDSLRYE
jgi:putative ABC transport system permease protein